VLRCDLHVHAGNWGLGRACECRLPSTQRMVGPLSALIMQGISTRHGCEATFCRTVLHMLLLLLLLLLAAAQQNEAPISPTEPPSRARTRAGRDAAAGAGPLLRGSASSALLAAAQAHQFVRLSPTGPLACCSLHACSAGGAAAASATLLLREDSA